MSFAYALFDAQTLVGNNCILQGTLSYYLMAICQATKTFCAVRFSLPEIVR